MFGRLFAKNFGLANVVKLPLRARRRGGRVKRTLLRTLEPLEARQLLDTHGLEAAFALPASPVVLTEDTPFIVTAISDGAPQGANFEVTEQPDGGHAAFDPADLIRQGSAFEIGEGQSLRLAGRVFEDTNGNGVQDWHSSDGEIGEVVYSDSSTLNWGANKIAAEVNFAETAAPYNGEHYISVDAPGQITGVKFSYINGESRSLEGLESIRFWGRSDESVFIRVAFRGIDGRFRDVDTIELTPGDWQRFELGLGELDTDSFTEVMFLAQTSAKFYLDEVSLLGDVESPVLGLTNQTPNVGVNLFANEDFTGDAAFVDVTRTMRRWGPVDAPWNDTTFSLPLTIEGVPREPAASVLYLRGYEPGIYRLKYRGTGNIEFRMAAKRDGVAEIVPGTTIKFGNHTEADVRITNTAVPIMLQLLEVDPDDPVHEIELLAPNYHESTQLFRNEFLDRLQPFSAVRFMDYTATNSTTASSWRDRRPAHASIQTSQLSAGNEGGVAWEYIVQLANEANVDAWINIPHLADDNYIRNLARFWKENYRADRQLILEFSNEVWNPLFPQFHATNQGDFYGIVSPRLVRMREIFDNVWGNEAGRVEIVLAGQAVNQFQINRALDYFIENGYEPSQIVDAVSVALYSNVKPDVVYDSIDDIMTDLLELDDERATIDLLVNTAKRFGLKTYAYEGGQHLRFGQTSTPEMLLDAQDDPRMGDLIRELERLWREAGGDLFMHYTFTGEGATSSQWGMLEHNGLAGSPKWDAMLAALVPPGDVDLNGYVDYEDFRVVRDNFRQVDRWWQEGDFDRDGQVGSDDLALLWQSLDVSRLSVLELNEVRVFARDNDVTLPSDSLSLEVSSLGFSEDSTAPITLTVRRGGSLFEAAELELISSEEDELVLPSHVSFAQGQAVKLVPLSPVNEGLLDGDQAVRITVKSPLYHDVSIDVVVMDAGLGIAEEVAAAHVVFLDENSNGLLDAGELSTETDANGNFEFEQITAGLYELRSVASDLPLYVQPSTVGVLAFTPSRDLQQLSVGEVHEASLDFAVSSADGSMQGTSQFTFEILGVNDAPIPQPVAFEAQEDGDIVVLQLEADDIDNDDAPTDLRFQLLQAPSEGDLRISSEGILTFDPGDDFQDLDVEQIRVLTASYQVSDAHGATGEAVINISVIGTDNDSELLLPPRITKVAVSSSQWSESFLSALSDESDGTEGFSLPALAVEQLEPISWTNIDRISVKFDQHVLVGRDHLQIHGVNRSRYTIKRFEYDGANHVATWTINLPNDIEGVGPDRMLLVLSEELTNRSGLKLDGEWLDTRTTDAFPSGDGAAGGEFQFRFDVLPGDVQQTGDGIGFVNSADTLTVRSKLGAVIGDAAYSTLLDINGSGEIDQLDFETLRAKQFTLLPDAEPTPQGPLLASPVIPAPGDVEITSRRRLQSSGLLAARLEDVSELEDSLEPAPEAQSASAEAPASEPEGIDLSQIRRSQAFVDQSFSTTPFFARPAFVPQLDLALPNSSNTGDSALDSVADELAIAIALSQNGKSKRQAFMP